MVGFRAWSTVTRASPYDLTPNLGDKQADAFSALPTFCSLAVLFSWRHQQAFALALGTGSEAREQGSLF